MQHPFSVRLTSEPLQPEAATHAVGSTQAGAVSVFIGTVREQTAGRKVVRLDFEAYEPMALKEMEKLIGQARERWPLLGAVIHHRVGTLFPPEIAVVIAVATPHRADSFAACQFLIDELKKTVPIWKKEVFEDGEVWVSAHP